MRRALFALPVLALALLWLGRSEAQAPSELDPLNQRLADADTLYLAMHLPPSAGSHELHTDSRVPVLLRADAQGFVVDAGLRSTRLHYDHPSRALSYDDDGPEEPVQLPQEAARAAAIVFSWLRQGLGGSVTVPVLPGDIGVVAGPREQWFRVSPGAGPLAVLLSTQTSTGRLARLGVAGLSWNGQELMARVEQMEEDVPLDSDMRDPHARPFHEHGIPSAWRVRPVREDRELTFHERVSHHVLTGEPYPVLQKAALACTASTPVTRETRRFVWEADTSAPSYPYMQQARADGCSLQVQTTARTFTRLGDGVSATIRLRALAQDKNASGTLWTQNVQQASLGPGDESGSPTFSWKLPSTLPPEQLRFSVEASYEITCPAGVPGVPGTSLVRAHFSGIEAPRIEWICP